jgi:hypothetical protein
MSHNELATLTVFGIGLTFAGILLCFACAWAIIRQSTRSTTEIAQITREVAFMIRRQYGDIDRDLQEIKELLGGQ